MCVIIHCPKRIPAMAVLTACEDANRHGGGMAWFSRTDGKIHWLKDIKAKDIPDLVIQHSIRPPVVIHFRISTVGGSIPALCHPFPITPLAETFINGNVDNSAGVLFHNGHVHDWETLMLAAGLSERKMPGQFSDTRGIAAVLCKAGSLDLLAKLNGYWVVMRNNHVHRYGQSWDKEQGCYFSNLSWKWQGAYRDTREFGWDGGSWKDKGPKKHETTPVSSARPDDKYIGFKQVSPGTYSKSYYGGTSRNPGVPSHYDDCNCLQCQGVRHEAGRKRMAHPDNCLCDSCQDWKARQVQHNDDCECNTCLNKAIADMQAESPAPVSEPSSAEGQVIPHPSTCNCDVCLLALERELELLGNMQDESKAGKHPVTVDNRKGQVSMGGVVTATKQVPSHAVSRECACPVCKEFFAPSVEMTRNAS